MRERKTFTVTALESVHYKIGDQIAFAGEPFRIVGIDSKVLTVEIPPTERQEILSRLTGKPPEDFIP